MDSMDRAMSVAHFSADFRSSEAQNSGREGQDGVPSVTTKSSHFFLRPFLSVAAATEAEQASHAAQ